MDSDASKASASQMILADVMTSDAFPSSVLPPVKLEESIPKQIVVPEFTVSNIGLQPQIKDGNNCMPLLSVDSHSRDLSEIQNSSQEVPPISSTVTASSGLSASAVTLGPEGNISVSASVPSNSTLVLEGSCSQATPVGMVTSTPVLLNSASVLDTGHLTPVQGEDLSMNEDATIENSKTKKRSRRLSQDPEARDINKSKEKIRWKDVWVAQLIHIRGRMHPTFTNPQRQRVDLWQIVEREMTNSCYGFDKDSEACRKKWLRVYKEYKDDLHHANKEESQKCRFYDLVDFYMGDRANRNLCGVPLHPDVLPLAKQLPPIVNEADIKAEDNGAIILHPNPNDVKGSTTKKPHAPKRPRVTEKLLVIEKPQPTQESAEDATPTKKSHTSTTSGSVHMMLSELVSIGKEMLQTTREYEKEKLSVLHSMKDMLGRIAKKM